MPDAQDTKPAEMAAPVTPPAPDPLAIAALQAQIADAHSKLDTLANQLAALSGQVHGGIAGQHNGRFTALEMRLGEVEAALVPTAAVAVEVFSNVCHSDPGLSQQRIRETMGPINLRVAKTREMQTQARPRVVPGEQFDPNRPDGSVLVAPDRTAPNFAPGFEPKE